MGSEMGYYVTLAHEKGYLSSSSTLGTQKPPRLVQINGFP